MEYFEKSLDNALSKKVANQLLEQVLSSELKPGDQVVENNYAEQFNISRSPVREAIYLLTMEGIIERVPRKGAFIKGYTIDEMKDLLDVRNSIEMLAVERLIKPSEEKKLLEEMRLVVHKMMKVENYTEYTHLNYQFHYLILKLSKSKVLIDMYSKISLPLLRIQIIHFSSNKVIEKSVKEHKEIYSCLVKDDISQLKTILRKHTEDVIYSVKSKLL
ncbi:GntR family transcriptional regulator [Mammaliicoccus sciuri]|uniref:DNA-binding transcriptional regulator, GntR family n=1 Tax=Sporosarcina newyorkensis TaxID=759851 RepID=A0A1T4YBT9_9BACL|nr:GntR family transcriptional regulator [Sporosarcina newyorkensis]SKA98988.1 DNA-binding transcriptional regulator, GntR family [Sporosarcina newyorkensis]